VPTLRDLMTSEVHTLDPDMTLREALVRFAAEGLAVPPWWQGAASWA
jgi:CBS-domain-containing membrane protein